MNTSQKIKIALGCFFLILIYFSAMNLIYFAPIPYSTTEGSFSLAATEDLIIYEKWARKVTVEIELVSGGPLLLIHTVISDDITDEIAKEGKFQDQFQTWRITLSTWGTTAINATGTYKIIDHTSPLLPKPKNNYVSTIEIYLQFMFLASIMLMGFLLVISTIIGLFHILKEKHNINSMKK
ncbi:MAG: hypothetical protein JSW11_02360 [Candidatus Heimdallarchaeota archaeon]|nr:MAG: hypothetical protein JSW11_02360 [Candidatus Heimdallarchaeota archaeon]